MSLLDSASLICTPNAYKEGKLYSVIPSDGSGDMSVTRATTATRVNSAGLVELVPYNLLQYSEQFNNAAWSKIASSVTANDTTAPNGTLTADKLVENTATSTHATLQQATTIVGSLYTFSVYVKAAERTNVRVSIVNSAGTVEFRVFANLTTGTFSSAGAGSPTSTSASMTSVGNGWYRISAAMDAPTTATQGIIYIQNTAGSTSYTGDGTSGIYLWGAQLNEGTLKDYFATETRLNIPRIDYSLGSCPSLLVEPQRTNLALRSQEFDNASWTKAGSTINANTTTAPDGTLTADSIIESATNATHLVLQSIAVTATNHTFSCYIKAVSGSNRNVGILFNSTAKGVLVNPSNGSVVQYFAATSPSDVTITSAANGWYRVSVTATTAAITESFRIYLGNGTTWNGPYLGDGTSSAYIWGAQLEAGAYPTSYIPTTSASVTRNAEELPLGNVYTNNWITASGGTLFVDLRNNINLIRNGSSGGIFLNTGTLPLAGDGFLFRNPTSSSQRISIVKYIAGTATTLYDTLTENVKAAIKWNGTTADVFVNGVKVVSATAFTTTAMQNLIVQGSNRNLNINVMALCPTPISDAELIEYTTI
jgi:hypothetical protein